jgi:ATP-dependent RNA helicase DeaD
LWLPTIGDVMSRRQERFKETIRETITEEGLESYLVLAEELGEEYGPTELAAAAFKLLLDLTPEETEDKLAGAEPPTNRSYDDGGKRSSRKPRDGGRMGAERGMTRLYLNIGREEGVRPGDIVGAIANEADIPGHSIGAIEIFDHFSLVDVPNNQSERVLVALKQTRIRSHKITATLAKATGKNKER